MPSPDFIDIEDEFLDSPHTQTEILGRGSRSRKSKTNFKNLPQAQVLAFIAGHKRRLLEVFRRLHAAHHTVPVETTEEVGHENGEVRLEKVTRHVPEVLSDQELINQYPVIREWEELHQEQVEHYPSIEALSIRATSRMPDEERQNRRESSSAGTDRRSVDEGGKRWD